MVVLMAGTPVMCGILMNRNSVLKMRLQRASSPLPYKGYNKKFATWKRVVP